MDREQYIKNLKDALKESFTQQQTNDILADYSEFFDAGLAEGKSESELCAEFGSPEKVARELLGSNSIQPHSSGQTRAQCILMAIVFILFLLFPFLTHNSSLFPSVSLFLLPLILQAIIYVGNNPRSEVIVVPSKFPRIIKKMLSGWPFYVIVLLTSIILGYYLTYDCIWLQSSTEDIFGYSIMLILLALIYIVRFVYPIKEENYHIIKIILILLYLLISVLTAVLIIFINKQNALLNTGTPPETELLPIINTIAPLIAIIFTLSMFSGILITIYAIHRNIKVRWIIFVNTTIISLLLNYIQVFSCGFSDVPLFNYQVFVSSRFAILQNTAATASFLLFLFTLFIWCKQKAKGELSYERADEKGNS